MNHNFWKSKAVLITGHTGFKGSWLSIILKKFGADVIGFSKDIPTEPSMYKIANVKDGIKSIIGNINDSNHINQVFEENKPEIVIHMAAQSIVRESYKNPLETFSTNVIGTVNILDAIRNSDSVKVVIIVTSDKCYRIKKDHSKYSEDDPMGGYDPYSSSKGCAELITSCYRNSFFNPKKFGKHRVSIASVRAGNVIGGGDWGQDRLLPDIMRGFFQDSTIKIRNPNAVRPWQFILDPLICYLELIELLWKEGPKYSGGWNIGPTGDDNVPKPVSWIVNQIEELLDGKIKVEYETGISELHEEDYLELDCSKVKTELGWQTKLSLKEALEWTSEWYRSYDEKKDMNRFSISQIERFMSL